MKSIHVCSASTGSIGEVTDDLILGLNGFFEVTKEGDDFPFFNDILLCHFINPALVATEEFNTFRKKVLIQPIDGTHLHKEIVDSINKFDLVITPANAGKDIMIANGVTVPIEVVPNFYKTTINIEGESIKQLPSDKIIFYHESTFHPRKGIEFLYEGFVRAFSDTEYADHVLLVCKDSPFNHFTFDKIEKLKLDTIKLQKQYRKPANIVKISQHLTWPQLKGLWEKTDVYVSFAKMEGFGIPLLRMAKKNKHILTLDASCNGYKDFLNRDNSILVPTTMVTASEEHMNLYTNETQWAIPTIEDVVKGFREAANRVLSHTPANFNQKELEKYEFSEVILQYKNIFENL